MEEYISEVAEDRDHLLRGDGCHFSHNAKIQLHELSGHFTGKSCEDSHVERLEKEFF